MLRTISLLVVGLVLLATAATALMVPEAIETAEGHRDAGRLNEAIEVMRTAVRDYPEDPKAHAYLGLYLGMSAGESSDMMSASALTNEAYEHLNRAVGLEPRDPHARHFRGLLGVNVPEFLGKLPGAVADLQQVITMYRASPDQVPFDMVVSSYLLIGTGRERQGNYADAEEAWSAVLDLAPGTTAAAEAQAGIDRVRAAAAEAPEQQSDGVDLDVMLEAAESLMDEGRFDVAESVLRDAIERDSGSAEAHKLLVRALGELAARGYDERIADDTDIRSNLAIEIMKLSDRAVELAPDDMEIRLMRGVVAVNLPFFVDGLDRGVSDLELVASSDAAEALRAEAQFHLGRAYQRRALSTWLDVVADYPNTGAAERAIEAMRPPVSHIDTDALERPVVVVEFVLGFQDELPPQTAVWIETDAGEYVSTLYVSGFSGNARMSQVNLPVWAGTSEFDGIDAVTAASLDVGHHIVTWDLRDVGGEVVPPGSYVARIEAKYWPSMEGDLAEVPFTLSGEAERFVANEGRLIPYVEVKVLP